MTLTRAQSRRAARVYEKIEVGFYVGKFEQYREVTLTTKAGVNNDLKTFTADMRKLIMALRRRGYEFEYLCERGLAPKNKLIHNHMVLRMIKTPNGGYYLDGKLVSQLWQKIHGAYRVEVSDIKSKKRYTKYVARHMIKAMKEIDARLMISSGWMPQGWAKVRKLLCAWVLVGSPEPEARKQRWSEMKTLYHRWAAGNQVVLPYRKYWIDLQEYGKSEYDFDLFVRI